MILLTFATQEYNICQLKLLPISTFSLSQEKKSQENNLKIFEIAPF
jgi:hypothetical protein